MSTTIQNIPNEILEQILVQVREKGGYSALKNALRVCRLWNDAGTPVLYEHVVLHNRNISSFLDSTFETHVDIWSMTAKFHELWCLTHTSCERNASSTFEEAKDIFAEILPSVGEPNAGRERKRIRNRERSWEQVHSLTLNVKPEGSGNTRDEEVSRRGGKLTPLDLQLMRLASMLPKQYPRLDTFSMFTEEPYFEHRSELERKGAGFLDARVFVELVKSLPETCINLELDTNGREIQFGPMSPRICTMIRDMMPRLRRLSLRVSNICESIVELVSETHEKNYVQAPNLRSLLVSFEPRSIPHWFDLMYARNVCRTTHSAMSKSVQMSTGSPLGGNDESSTLRFAGALQEARQNGAFPQARSIQVVTPMKIHRRGWAWSKREDDQMMIIRDCVQDKTHALQFIPSNRKFCHDKDRALINRHGVFAMGDHEKLKVFAEESVWSSTATYHARLPIDTPEVGFEKCPLKTLSSEKEMEYFVVSLARESHVKLKCLHEDLTEEERHPGRIFEFEGATFPFRDFMSENF
ncbi:hypothetical protein E4T39_04046 [Aureobasidium subglaciale]|nr:hypothetical protein E4T39_04046 [Aureobasidium subglaciale]